MKVLISVCVSYDLPSRYTASTCCQCPILLGCSTCLRVPGAIPEPRPQIEMALQAQDNVPATAAAVVQRRKTTPRKQLDLLFTDAIHSHLLIFIFT
jgi:hypothetical protein